MKIPCIIVDDDLLYCELITSLVEADDRLHLMGTYSDPEDARKCLLEEDIQVVFMDQKMPQMSGIELINSLPDPPFVIFITSYANHAIESYELDAVDYILKPLRPERFKQAVNKAVNKIELSKASDVSEVLTLLKSENDYFIVRMDAQYIKIKYVEVLYIEAVTDFIKIHTINDSFLVLLNLKTLAAVLPVNMFVRTHRSFIIGIIHMTSFDATEIKLGKATIPLSHTYKDSVFEKLLSSKLVKR